MTEKDLRRLRRQDLLELMLAQGKEAAAFQAELEEKNEEMQKLQESYGRLIEKLDEKDALIEKLKGRLNQKDTKIHELRLEMEIMRSTRRIELKKAGSIAEAALRLNGVFEAAQRAADQYLYNISLLQKEQEQLMGDFQQTDKEENRNDTEGCT